MKCATMRPVVALALAAAVLLTAQSTEARRRRAMPIQIRMVTYVGEKLEGIRPDFSWLVTYKGKPYQLYITKLDVLNGSVTPLDIDAAVAPYRVKFQMAGEKTALQRFAATPPRQQVVIMGYARLDPAGRYLMIDKVEGQSVATPSPGE